MFLKWSDDLVMLVEQYRAEADVQVTMDAFAAYSEYMTGMIAEHKTDPTDDLVSVLVHAEVEGGLEDHQVVTEVLTAADRRRRDHPPHPVGGNQAAVAPPRSAQAAHQRFGPAAQAIEEMLRWTAPVKNMARTITADTEFHGTKLRRARR